MKKILYPAMLMATALLPMVGCSDDDNNDVKGQDSWTLTYQLQVKLSDSYLASGTYTIEYLDFDGNYGEKAIGTDGATIELTGKSLPASITVDLVSESNGSEATESSYDFSVEVSQRITATNGDQYQILGAGSYDYSSTMSGVTAETAETVLQNQMTHLESFCGEYALTLSGSTVNCVFTPIADLMESEAAEVDALDFFSSNLIAENEDGTYERLYGVALNSDTPDVISIGVDSYDDAVTMFKGWVFNESQLTETANGIIFKPIDEDGNTQGTITLNKESGDNGLVATLSFADGASVAHVEAINFYLTSAWPGNGSTTYHIGDAIRDYKPPFKKDTQCLFWESDKPKFNTESTLASYLCINEASAGQTAYFIYVHYRRCHFGGVYNVNDIPGLRAFVSTYLPSTSTIWNVVWKIKESFGTYSDFAKWLKKQDMEMPNDNVWLSWLNVDTYSHNYIHGKYKNSRLALFDLANFNYYNGDFDYCFVGESKWDNYTCMSVRTRTAQ